MMCARVSIISPTYSLQAYRLEPLINSAYERVKPVKVDRCNAGPSGTSQELACGPRKEADMEPPQKKGGWMSYLPSLGKGSIAASEAAASASTANNTDKKVHTTTFYLQYHY